MDHNKIICIIGDDIYYRPHKFELLPYIRQKPFIKDTFIECYKASKSHFLSGYYVPFIYENLIG